MSNLSCGKCKSNVPDTDTHTVVSYSADFCELQRHHFCSAMCWVTWFLTIDPADFRVLVPPALDSYDIARAQKAIKAAA